MTNQSQDQAVAEFMKSLKFVWDEEQEAWVNEKEGIAIHAHPALFFYTICQKAEREALGRGYYDACLDFTEHTAQYSVEQALDDAEQYIQTWADLRREETQK